MFLSQVLLLLGCLWEESEWSLMLSQNVLALLSLNLSCGTFLVLAFSLVLGLCSVKVFHILTLKMSTAQYITFSLNGCQVAEVHKGLIYFRSTYGHFHGSTMSLLFNNTESMPNSWTQSSTNVGSCDHFQHQLTTENWGGSSDPSEKQSSILHRPLIVWLMAACTISPTLKRERILILPPANMFHSYQELQFRMEWPMMIQLWNTHYKTCN